MSIHAPLCVGQTGLIDTGVANEAIDWFVHAEFVDLVTELLDAVKRVELALKRRKAFQVESIDLSNNFHLVEVPHGANYMILSRSEERQGCFAAQARRSTSDDHQFYKEEDVRRVL